MASDLNRLEESIFSKVQQRTPSRIGEEVYLARTFRYHDLSGSGWLEFEAFRRTLVPFASGVADADLRRLFERYASNGAVCYKDFVHELAHGARRQQPRIPEAPGEVCETAQETLARLKRFLFGQGPWGIVGLAAAFQGADPENLRSVSRDTFCATLRGFLDGAALRLADEQVRQLFGLQGQTYAVDQIAYDDFLMALTGELSQERRSSTRAAFRKLDCGSEGLVDVAHMVRAFNAHRHPHVSDGSRQPDEVLSEFADTLRDFVAFRRGQRACTASLVAWEEFEDYYTFVSGCYETDELFCTVLQKVWDLDKVPNAAIEARASMARAAAGVPARARSGLHHWQSDTLPANPTHCHVEACVGIGNVMLRARQHIARKGIRAAVAVVKNFYVADDDVDDMLDVYEFRRACQQSGLAFHDAEESLIFDACGTGGPDGAQPPKIHVRRFFQLLHGELSPTRRSVVEQAFEALGGDARGDGLAISPAALKERFACEAHPSVARGEAEARTVLAEFLDSFSLLAHVLGGCENGMVAFADFLGYYEVVSSTIENDTFFDLLLRRLWLPPDAPGGPPPAPSYESPPSPLKGGASRAAADRSPPQTGAYHRYHRREDAAAAPPSPSSCASRRLPAAGPPSASSRASEPEGELGTAIGRLRGNLARRGLKGWRSLAQRFEQYDYKGNGTVMRLDWERLHKTLGLGLAPEDRDAIFKGLSVNRRDGAMDYGSCLRLARGALPERRQVLVKRLFEAFRSEPGVVPVSALKASFDAKNSPACLLGGKDAQEEAQEFNDALDFFGRNGCFNSEEFATFFSMVSVIHNTEDEFRLMTTAAFRTPPAPMLGGC